MKTPLSFDKLALTLIRRTVLLCLALIPLTSLARNELQVCDSHVLVRGAEMAINKACLGCHTLDTKRVGPTYIEIATRYEHNPDMVLLLANKIKHGSNGIWGAAVMPANPVTDEDALILARWILTLRGVRPPENQFSSRLRP
nr:c-type cytochrome [uncultured Rhodoferax sp.]